MKNWHKAIIFSVVAVLILGLAIGNVFKAKTEKAEEAIANFKENSKISDEFYTDSKQVFEMLEKAHDEQRELTADEQSLFDEYAAKYKSDELTRAELQVMGTLIVMREETVPSSQLESEKNVYEEQKEFLLKYVDF